MLDITSDFLTINDYSRNGKKLKKISSIVLHWTANPLVSAKKNRDFFESRKDGKNGYGSAHLLVDDANIICCIPLDEVAYHCGTSQVDSVSGKVYTDYARNKFGEFCINYTGNSPNNCTIGIEMVPLDNAGNFSVLVWNNTIELCAYLLTKFFLNVEDVTYHSQIIGTAFKKCPKLFVDIPSEFDKFKSELSVKMTS